MLCSCSFCCRVSCRSISRRCRSTAASSQCTSCCCSSSCISSSEKAMCCRCWSSRSVTTWPGHKSKLLQSLSFPHAAVLHQVRFLVYHMKEEQCAATLAWQSPIGMYASYPWYLNPVPRCWEKQGLKGSCSSAGWEKKAAEENKRLFTHYSSLQHGQRSLPPCRSTCRAELLSQKRRGS